MPLCRALLLALCLPLASMAAAPEKQAPDPASPVTTDQFEKFESLRSAFETIGYRLEKNSQRLVDAEGRALKHGELKRLLSPFDIRKSPHAAMLRDTLQNAGYRVDENTGHILSPYDRQPISNFNVEIMIVQIGQYSRHAVLERIYHMLAQQDPGQPVSAEVLKELRHLAAQQKEGLPKELVKALEAGETLKTAALKKTAGAAYAESTRFFDGQTPFLEHAGRALPRLGEFNSPAKVPLYYYDRETRLGKALSADFAAALSKNPAGRELIERFRKQNGKLDLPGFLILKNDASKGAHTRALAVYNPGSKAVVYEQFFVKRVLMDRVLKGLPKAELERLDREFEDPQKITSYLLKHPDVRRRFVESIAIETGHELTHAWQDRRSFFTLETRRGNISGSLPLEWEHEAYLFQVRYLHAQVKKDPAAVVNSYWYQTYLDSLSNFDRWRENISKSYLQDHPSVSATFATIADLQRTRKSIARHLMGDSLYSWAVQKLKVLGFDRGDEALKQTRDQNRSQIENFLAQDYARMRAEGFQALAEYADREGRPDRAFTLYSAYTEVLKGGTGKTPGLSPEEVRQRRDEAAIETADWLNLPGTRKTVDAMTRAKAIGALSRHFQNGNPPESYYSAHRITYQDVVADRLAKARAAKDPVMRAHQLEYAESFAKAIPDQDLLAKIESLRKQKVPVK